MYFFFVPVFSYELATDVDKILIMIDVLTCSSSSLLLAIRSSVNLCIIFE